MKQRKIGMLKVGVVLLQILLGANLAGAAGIGFGFEGSNTYLIQNTGVTLLSSVHQFDAVFGAGNGIVYGRAGNALCKIDSTGVTLVGPSTSWGGITQYAGAGNGKAYVMVGNVVFLIDGTNYAQVPTTWSSAARLVGAGNGTAFILEGNGTLWKLTGTTYSSCPSNWAGTTTFFSAGKEEALLKQGAGVYRAHGAGYWSHGSFNDATQYASGGIGVGYALENNKLYRLPASSGGYQSLTGTWSSTLSPTWMVGLGNGDLYLIDENATLYFMGATATTAQQFSYSWTPTLFEGLGDGDAVYMQNGSLYYLTGISYSPIGSGTYNFTKIVGAMDIDSGTVEAYIPRPAAAAPVFDLASRYISGPTFVGISCATPGAQIYYTLDGTPPTSASTLYTGPVEVDLPERLSAIAIAPDYEYSPVTKVTFLPLYNSPVLLEDDFTDWRVSHLLWEKNNPGTTLPLIDWNNNYMCVGPDVNGGTGYKSQTKYDYAWTSGVATFWVEDWGSGAMFGLQSASNSLVLNVTNEYDNATVATRINNGTPNFNPTWSAGCDGVVASIVQIEWDNVVGTVKFRFYDNTSRTVASGALPTTWQDETTYTFTPSGEPLYLSTYSYGGPNTYFEHIRVESISVPVAAAPVFTPSDKYITAPTSVAIASATAGAQIYYTLNGTEPSAASLSYSAPVQVNPGDTLKAIAIANGYSSSAVTSTTYIPAFDVPAVGSIAVDGSLSDWPVSAVWSQSFLPWVGSMSSTTRAKFAWNDAQNLLYVAIETDQATVGLPGGHPVVGFGTSLNQTAYLGDGATQLAFEALTGNSVRIFNEIHEYKLLYPNDTISYIDSGIAGVQAAYSSNGSIWTYEIAIPMWTNWAVGQMTTKTNLVPDSSIYVYSLMQEALNGSNGTNLSYKGNPGFANPGGFNYAAKLILLPLAGDANKDGKVDVGDLGILAANYGGVDKTWSLGDFNKDGKVDVGDLGILAANYGQGSSQALNFSDDYAKVFGTTASADETEDETVGSSMCSGLGLPLIAALALMGLMLVKLED